jgi:hypothetical protein
MMGLLGMRFVKRPKTVSERQYEKIYKGRLFSSVVFNTIYGLGQIVVVLAFLSSVDSFRFGFTLGTGMLVLGATAGAILLAWKYEGTIA